MIIKDVYMRDGEFIWHTWFTWYPVTIHETKVIDDMGRIPTVQDYLEGMPMYSWLGGPKITKRTITMVD